MAPGVERRSGSRQSPQSRDRSESPNRKSHGSPRQKKRLPDAAVSPRRERLQINSSSRGRSPVEKKLLESSRSPKRARPRSLSRSPVRNGSKSSLSPRTKRLHRSHAEREVELDKDQRRNSRQGESEFDRPSNRVQKNYVREQGDRKKSEQEEFATERSSEKDHKRNSGRGERVAEDLYEGQERGTERLSKDHKRNPRMVDQEMRRPYEKETSRGSLRENHEPPRHRESGKESSSGRRSVQERNDDFVGRSSRRERLGSIEEHDQRGRRELNSRGHNEDAKTRVGAVSSDGEDSSVAKMNAAANALQAKEKEKPSFELSGKLAEETNRVAGVTLLYNEPPEACKPDIRWRLYVFKSGEVFGEPLYIHRQSSFLFGRERKVADVPTDHPSCSKQHAVLQFRQVDKEMPDGMMSKQVRPYVMDLGSTNGTFINDNRIEDRRYYELFEKDTIRFGNSSREYVLLHENSAS